MTLNSIKEMLLLRLPPSQKAEEAGSLQKATAEKTPINLETTISNRKETISNQKERNDLQVVADAADANLGFSYLALFSSGSLSIMG